MKNERFKRVIILGYGQIAGDVLCYVREQQKNYGYIPEFIEHEIQRFSVIEKICQEKGAVYKRIIDKEQLIYYLDALQEKALIISAYNSFLFPKRLVKKENITIINFHNALLPAYPGRNAPTWAIYMEEKETGITWHYVTESVDAGNIIIQKRCMIGRDMRAYELSGILMNLAFEGFKEIFSEVLNESIVGQPQCIAKNRRVYRSWEVPGNGRFSMEDAPQEIYRLLRSVDYGKMNIFPYLRTVYQGVEIEILRYRKMNKSKVVEGDNLIYLPYDEDNVLRLKYQNLCIGESKKERE